MRVVSFEWITNIPWLLPELGKSLCQICLYTSGDQTRLTDDRRLSRQHGGQYWRDDFEDVQSPNKRHKYLLESEFYYIETSVSPLGDTTGDVTQDQTRTRASAQGKLELADLELVKLELAGCKASAILVPGTKCHFIKDTRHLCKMTRTRLRCLQELQHQISWPTETSGSNAMVSAC